MWNPPKNIEEAQAYRYRQWAGNSKGDTFKPDRCAYEATNPTGWGFYQCSRKPKTGPGNLYCKQHAKMIATTETTDE